ncbi:hypothetical protein ACFQWF_14330 [Methylorubrum suomiense]
MSIEDLQAAHQQDGEADDVDPVCEPDHQRMAEHPATTHRLDDVIFRER